MCCCHHAKTVDINNSFCSKSPTLLVRKVSCIEFAFVCFGVKTTWSNTCLFPQVINHFSGTILIHEISPSHPHTWGPRGPDRCISRVIQSYRNMATFRQKQSRTCPWLVWHCGLVPHTTYDLWTSLLLFLVENSLVFLILDNSFKYINIVGVFLNF